MKTVMLTMIWTMRPVISMLTMIWNKTGHKAFLEQKAKMEKKKKPNSRRSTQEQQEMDELEANTDQHQATIDEQELVQETEAPQLRRGSRLRKRKNRELEVPLVIKEPVVSKKVVPPPILENNGKAPVVEVPKKAPKRGKKKGFTGQSSKSTNEQPTNQFVPPRPAVEAVPPSTEPAATQVTVGATRASSRLLSRRTNEQVSFSNKANANYMKKRIAKRGEEEPMFE